MNTGLVIGLIAGLIAAGVVVYFVLRARGYFQYLGGKKRSSVPPVNRETLIDRLLRLNDLSQPYNITKGKETDVLVERKSAEAVWEGVLNKEESHEAYRAYILIDDSRHAVRYYEETGLSRWVEDANGLRQVTNYHRSSPEGWMMGKLEPQKSPVISKETAVKTEKPRDNFDINKIRLPVISVIRESGWELVLVRAKKHAVHNKTTPQQ